MGVASKKSEDKTKMITQIKLRSFFDSKGEFYLLLGDKVKP